MKREMWFAMGMMIGLVACAVEPVEPPVASDQDVEVSRQDLQSRPDFIGGGACASLARCYCTCRLNHQCIRDASQCTPLANCLNSCDSQNPGTSSCSDNGPFDPRKPSDCL